MRPLLMCGVMTIALCLSQMSAYALSSAPAKVKLKSAKSVKGNMLCVGPTKAKAISMTGKKFKVRKSTFSVVKKSLVEKQSDCKFTYTIM